MASPTRKIERPKQAWDFGRAMARVLCALLALVGLLPFLAVFLAHSAPVQRWATAETARLLRSELGLEASYSVSLSSLPLEVALERLVVPASDGGAPAARAARISVRPRLFSLLAGRLDAGDIEVERLETRLIIRDGRITNLRYRLPRRSDTPSRLERAPFASLALTDSRFDLDFGDTKIRTGPVDLDVFAERGLSFEIALRSAESRVERVRSAESREPEDPAEAASAEASTSTLHDEDVLCRADARLRIQPDQILIRRLSLLGLSDRDPRPGSAPACSGNIPDTAPNKVAARVSQFRVQLEAPGAPILDGYVILHGPLALLNRFVETQPLHGTLGFAGQVRYHAGRKLAELSGKLKGQDIAFSNFRLAKYLEAELELHDGRLLIPDFRMGFADGDVQLENALLELNEPGIPIRVERVHGDRMLFQGLMRDLAVTRDTVVKWELTKTHVTKIEGHLLPLKLDANLVAETRDFEVFDRAFHDPARRHMIGVRGLATVHTRIGVRPNAFQIYDSTVRFGESMVKVGLVSIGFDNQMKLEVLEGSTIDLKDASPLVDVPMAGKAKLTASMSGPGGDPLLTGKLSVDDFVLGGFPLGNVHSADVRFQPLKLDISDARAEKGGSAYTVSSARLDFDSGATLLADARVESKALDVRDFFDMWHFDEDPRFDSLRGSADVNARIHYALGGPEDRCKSGALRVDGKLRLTRAEAFEERYDSGLADFDFRWLDRDASYRGIELDVPNMTLQKGSGTLLGSFRVRRGAKLDGNFVATGVPLLSIDAFSKIGLAADGNVSAVGSVGGTLDELEAQARVEISEVRLGSSAFPPSAFSVELRPDRRPIEAIGSTSCGQPIAPPFNPEEYAKDQRDGVFHVDGRLFGGQVELDDLSITRNKEKSVWGRLELKQFGLGALAELSPGALLSETKPQGAVSASIDIDHYPLGAPGASRVKVVLREFSFRQGRLELALLSGSDPISLAGGTLEVPSLAFRVSPGPGTRAVIDVRGRIEGVGRKPEVSAALSLRPIDLSELGLWLPRAERSKGTLSGRVQVEGQPHALRYSGGFEVKNGELFVRGLPSPITDIDLALSLDSQELRVARGSARLGGGTLKLSGSAPLRRLELGEAHATITARDINLPLTQGVRGSFDADLVATYAPDAAEDKDGPATRLTGNVTLTSFEYTRPVTMSADISTLAQRGQRTKFETYDPNQESVAFEVALHASQPLKIRNNLVEADLTLGDQGLVLGGTNQRFGLRGALRLKPGGRIQLRRNEFEIRQGLIRFDDLTRIAPQVDVTAVTEYRRYSDALGETDVSASASARNSTGGNWLIRMHAFGDADKLRIDLTSDPALAQDDIFLLLTVGLTRAELDQAQSASVGGSVALEALGALTGADRAVTDAVPVIDEFRFGSAYSSRNGRTEPTVTIGKRLAERIRANVTSGLADSREIRSNVEWQLSSRVSVEGSYDNVNDISSSSLGNLGADVRWRLEFE